METLTFFFAVAGATVVGMTVGCIVLSAAGVVASAVRRVVKG